MAQATRSPRRDAARGCRGVAERGPATNDDHDPHWVLLAKAFVSAALAVGWAMGEAPFMSTLGLPSLLAEAGDSATVTTFLFVLAVVLVAAAIGLFSGGGWAGCSRC